MSLDFTFALYVFCSDYHGGQSSRLYRILSRVTSRGIRISDHAEAAIRRGKNDPDNEWEQARTYYRQLKRKYANDRR
jgi:hypothetical protein